MAKHIITTVIPQNLALEAGDLAGYFWNQDCTGIASHFTVLANTICRAAIAAPEHSAWVELPAEWCPAEDCKLPGPFANHTFNERVRVCVLSLDEVERQELAHWAGNVQRTTGITEALFRMAGLVRDWMRYDARPVAPLYEPVRVLSAADDIYTV